jgi:hypothetical protein
MDSFSDFANSTTASITGIHPVITYITEGRASFKLPAKAKTVPIHATKALEGEEVELLLILDLGTRLG